MIIKSIQDLEKRKEIGLRQIYPDVPKILVGMATCGLAAGAQKVFDALQSRAAAAKFQGLVEKTGCIGFCYKEPLMDLVVPGAPRITYERATPELAGRILDGVMQGELVTEQILGRIDVDELLLDGGPRHLFDARAEAADPRYLDIPPYQELDFYKLQNHIAMRNCGFIDPANLDHYLARGGYAALYKALTEMSPQDVVDEVTRSKLRGRGGGGFPTGVKWNSCRKAHGDIRYVICNADEGDPGAYMDRSLIEGDPHSILEGMLIGAYAVGASQGYIYVRAEYPLAVRTLRRAIDSARACGFLGQNIFDTDFSFDLQINLGGGAFVCGESTALMASIEGKPGEPRAKYIHTVEKGLWDRPTVLNNVESWANVPVIIQKGADWYAGIGTEGSSGTKIFSLVGKVNHVGLVEVPMGTSISDIVETIGGGTNDGRPFKAVQTGGPSGGCIPYQFRDAPVDFDSLWELGSMMGSGGMIVMDEHNCMVDISKYFLSFLEDESCGKCMPCRLGIKRMREILDGFSHGQGTVTDIDELVSLAEAIKDGSLCALGGSAPNPVLTTIRYFRDEYEAHILEKRCPAGVCRDLIQFVIDPELCNGCTLCLHECPTGAVSGEKKQPHVIAPELCVKCGACYDACKFDAVSIV